MQLFRFKELALPLLLILALQFCSPVPANAGDQQLLALETLTIKDLGDADTTLKVAFEHVSFVLITIVNCLHFVTADNLRHDRSHPLQEPLLPVAGLFPSAP